jgi:hypothetical protein
MRRGVSRSSLLSLAAVAAAGVVWLATGGQLPGLGERAPVLVVLVGDRETVNGVREAVAEEKILVSSPDGFAVRERRIVASGAEAVGDLLMRAGWADAKLEIVTPGSSRAARDGAASTANARDAELNALRAKPTLNAVDAARALKLLE